MLSQTDYRAVVEQAPLMIWRANADAKADYFNERWLAFTGRSMDDEIGDGWAQGVHPQDLDRCLSAFLFAFGRRESFEMEYRLRRYDGEYRWVAVSGAPIYNATGQFAGFAGSCVDVTERVQARAILARVHLKELGIV